MNGDEKVALVWLLLAVVAFVGCYKSTTRIRPATRWERSAWLKALALSFPWAFLLAPTMAFGAIPMPMPAGLLIIGWLWGLFTQAPYLQGPHNATGPIACMAFLLTWVVFFVGTLFGLQLSREEK